MSIKEKQNNKEYLSLQYSARHAYNTAELFGILSWLLMLILILVGWFDEGKHPTMIAYVTAIITIIGAVIDYSRTKIIKLAAGIRTYIDCNLFGFKHKSVYNGYDVANLLSYRDFVSKHHRKTYEKQISHSGTDKYKGVKDWYILNDSMTFQEEIKTAQKENCGFDEKISKYSCAFSVIVFIVFAICIFKFDNYFLLICAFIPAFLKIAEEMIAYKECNRIHVAEKIIISKLDDTDYDEKLSLQLQECIDERRQLQFITNSLFHKLSSTRLHKRYSEQRDSY